MIARSTRGHGKVYGLVLIAVFAALGAQAQMPMNAEMAAGYKATITCSAIFVAHRDPKDIARDELGGADGEAATLEDTEIDRENKCVKVSYEGGSVPRLAVFHKDLGTVLLPPGATLEDAASIPTVDMPLLQDDPARIPWPNGDLVPSAPLPPEVDKAQLDQAVELAFTGEKYDPHKTLGVVVVYKGQLIAERYAPSWNMHTQYRSWSTAKSITNALVGITVGMGKLKVKDPAPIPEWQGAEDSRRHITIENLLHMSSGLKSQGAGTTDAYFGGIDTAAAATASQPEKEPGTRWKYSNYDTLLLVRSIKLALGGQETYLKFPRTALLNKIGMRHTFPQTDPHGNYILSSQMYTTARDLARFGMLYLNDGVWFGERILPEGWVGYTVQRAPAKEKSEAWGYGAQFWLLGDDPRIPDDAYSTAGARGQLSTIVPSRNVVIARTGLDPQVGGKWDQVEFVKDVLAAIAE